MSVVGIDFGTQNLTVAQCAGQGGGHGGGVSIVLNEGSGRFTPAIVGFQDKKRHLGALAGPTRKSNYKNTVTDVKRFIGCKWSEPAVQEDLKRLFCQSVQLDNDEIGFKVKFNGEDKVFTPTQIFSMLLGNVQDFTSSFTGKRGSDMVISVPSYFTDAQRRATVDAAKIAGVNCLRLFNETTAAAFNYGFYKSQKGIFDEEKPTYVMFCDMGYSSFQVSIVSFIKGSMEVKATTYDRNLGGRDWDERIADTLNKKFLESKKINCRDYPKSWMKLLAASEKAKKTLSPQGVSKARVHLECLYKENDFSSELIFATKGSIESFEKGIQHSD